MDYNIYKKLSIEEKNKAFKNGKLIIFFLNLFKNPL